MLFKRLRPALAVGAAAAALSFAAPAFAWQDFSPWQDFSQLRPHAFNYSCVYNYPSAVKSSIYCPVYGYWGYPDGWPNDGWWRLFR